MPKYRDLSRSLQFRYWVEDCARILTWAFLAIAAIGLLVAAVLAAFGPLAGLIDSTWTDVWFFFKWASLFSISGVVLPLIADIICDYSDWRDNHAASKGLTYWPYELRNGPS